MNILNVDFYEFVKFGEFVYCWWDLNFEFKFLYEINLLCLDWIEFVVFLVGKKVFDVGCGGGLLLEGMVVCGVNVMGIDLLEKLFGVVWFYFYESGFSVDYQLIFVEDMVVVYFGVFDVVICLEMFEYVLDLVSIVVVCVKFVKLGGYVFFLMFNCNLKFYFFVVVGVEYIFNLLLCGMYDYVKFIKLVELSCYCRNFGFMVEEICGMSYNLLSKIYSLGWDSSVNYLICMCSDV